MYSPATRAVAALVRVGETALRSSSTGKGGLHGWLEEEDAPAPDVTIDPDNRTPEAVKRALVRTLMAKDKEVFDLKRLHELSLTRVEQHHERLLKNHEEKAIYTEDMVNKQALETVEVTEHEFAAVKKHRDMSTNMKYLIAFLNVAVTILCMRWLYFWYASDPRRHYTPTWTRIHGSHHNYKEDFDIQMQKGETPVLPRGLASMGQTLPQ